MASISIPALRCGGPSHLPYSIKLRAGPLTMLLEQGELRRIKMGSREILRRIYSSLRGPDWEPIPATLSDQKVEAKADAFQVSFVLTHQQAGFHLIWQVSIEGNAQGTLSYKIHGRAMEAFALNRASLCVLHPLRECVGRPVRLNKVQGKLEYHHFPENILPHQPFLDLESLSHEIEPDLWAKLTYTGDIFEMEDQRNWSDGSFKTYSPPQARPKPMAVAPGWETNLSVTLELDGKARAPGLATGVEASSPCTLSPLLSGDRPAPTWGFGAASHQQPLGVGDAARIKILAPTHLRANFWVGHPGCSEQMLRAAEDAKILGVPLEVAVLIPDTGMEVALADFAAAFKQVGANVQQVGTKVLRWLIFPDSRKAMPSSTLVLARQYLQNLDPLARFAMGSNEDFVLLNRNRPVPDDSVDLAFAVSPQIHLNDNRTLVEGLEGQAWTMRSFSALWPHKKALVTPITLKRSPLAAALKLPALLARSDAWKSQVDTRQFSLLGAGWTLGSLKRLALEAPSAGLSATYYETTGLLGLMTGQNLSVEALSVPGSDLQLDAGWVFPLYHIFADFAEFSGGRVHDIISRDPLRFDGVLLSLGNRRAILLANLEETPGRVQLHLDAVGQVKGIRRLNEKNAMQAMCDPEAYRVQPYESVPNQVGSVELDFMPFECIRLDLE